MAVGHVQQRQLPLRLEGEQIVLRNFLLGRSIAQPAFETAKGRCCRGYADEIPT